MDIDVQNFDSGAMAFVDDNDYSNLLGLSKEMKDKIKSNAELIKVGQGVKLGVVGGKKRKKINFKPNTRQQMWIRAFRNKNKEVENLTNKLKLALKEGNKEQKKSYENKIQALLNELKQLMAQNEDLLKKNNSDAIPQEVVKEVQVLENTEYDTPTPEIVDKVSEKTNVLETTEEETMQPTTNKMNWIIPALGIGIIAYFIFKK